METEQLEIGKWDETMRAVTGVKVNENIVKLTSQYIR